MVLFQNYFVKITPQHADSKYDSCHLIQCGRADSNGIMMNNGN